MTSPEQFIDIRSKYNEIVRCIDAGTLNQVAVAQALQNIIDSKWTPPSWWRTPEQQLERAEQLWPHLVLPQPPKRFLPQSKHEVPLLHVRSSFRVLWSKVEPPAGYSKVMGNYVDCDVQSLRTTPGKIEFTEAVWLGFDPQRNKDEVPEDLWSDSDLAGPEVLSALIQFPDWPLSWTSDNPAPFVSGYQAQRMGKWECVPYLTIFKNHKELKLNFTFADEDGDHRPSPVVRVL